MSTRSSIPWNMAPYSADPMAGQAQPRQLLTEGIDPVGIEERLAELGWVPEPVDEPTPDLVHLGLGTVLVDAPDDLCRLDEGIVGPEGLGGMAGDTLDGEDAPVDALLAHDHRQSGP